MRIHTLPVTPATDAEEDPKPATFRLSVYPNPAVGAVTVALTLPSPQTVRVAVFDVVGREVAVLHDGPLRSGMHRLTLDGRGLPSGLYIVRATGGGLTAAQRFTLVR